jgi:hypothetical protein
MLAESDCSRRRSELPFPPVESHGATPSCMGSSGGAMIFSLRRDSRNRHNHFIARLVTMTNQLWSLSITCKSPAGGGTTKASALTEDIVLLSNSESSAWIGRHVRNSPFPKTQSIVSLPPPQSEDVERLQLLPQRLHPRSPCK